MNDRLAHLNKSSIANPSGISQIEDRPSGDELVQIKQAIGRRLVEALDTENFSEIARQLQTTPSIAKLYVEGKRFPAPEMQIRFRRVTGISIDWLLTGAGPKYVKFEDTFSETNLFSEDEVKDIERLARENGRSFFEQAAKLAGAGLKFLEKLNSWKKD